MIFLVSLVDNNRNWQVAEMTLDQRLNLGPCETVAPVQAARHVAFCQKCSSRSSRSRSRMSRARCATGLVYPRPRWWTMGARCILDSFCCVRSALEHEAVSVSRSQAHSCHTTSQGRRSSEDCERKVGPLRYRDTLDTYSHVLPGMQEAAAQRIDATLSSVVQSSRCANQPSNSRLQRGD